MEKERSTNEARILPTSPNRQTDSKANIDPVRQKDQRVVPPASFAKSDGLQKCDINGGWNLCFTPPAADVQDYPKKVLLSAIGFPCSVRRNHQKIPVEGCIQPFTEKTSNPQCFKS